MSKLPIINKLSNALELEELARQQRAIDQGFTTDAYHGSSGFKGDKINENPLNIKDQMTEKFLEPHKGFYSSDDPEIADWYGGGYETLPLKLNTKEYLYYDANGENWSKANPKAIAEAKKQGKKGVIIENVEEGVHEDIGGTGNIFISLDPSTVRSRFAKFDPANEGKSGLLLSKTPMLTPVDYQPEFEDNKVDPFNVGMSEALPAPQARLRAKELFSDFGKAFMSGLQDSGRAGATSMMEALENQYVPEGAVGINDAGQWTDKQGNPLNVQRRPNIVPLTKTAEGGYEGAMPAMADVWNTMGGVGKAATLGAGPVLRPALKYKDKIYKAKEGQQHLDALPVELQDTFQKMAMSGEDISHFNFGFINHKGHFLQREDALKYAIDNGLLDPNDAKYGTLVTTMLNDSGGGQKVASQAGQALKEKAPTFYSAAEKAVEGIKQNKASGDQWLSTIANQKGVKGEELEWIGLKEFLSGKQSVTKQEIQDYLKNNKVELQEVWKRSDNKYNYKTHDEWYNAIQVAERRNDWNEVDNLNRAWEASEGVGGVGSPKYSKWQLPGGENYRELLMTLPDKQQRLYEWEYFDPKTQTSKQFKTEAEAKAAAPEGAVIVPKETKTLNEAYKSSHWDEPNILAHMRMNDRVIDGKKSLHLEEIQSDWHQQGRDKGYKSSKPLNQDELQELGSLKGKSMSQELTDIENRRYDELLSRNGEQSGLVPDAPFKKTWHELALKRAIREAAENGYERLSWTPGEAQAARYDLSKQVKEIAVPIINETGERSVRIDPIGGGTSFKLMVDKNGKVDGSYSSAQFQGKDLSDVVGKEMADKIMNLKTPDTFSGEGLKIGGEGMKGFYDQIIPKSIEKIAKEFGVKVKKGKVKTNKTGYEYNGPELSLNDMQNRTGKFTHKEDSILGDITIAMSEGMSFKDAMSKYGNKEIAKKFGGELKPIVKDEPIYYIDIPENMRQSIVGKGQPLFSGTNLTPIDYQPEFEEETK